MKGHRSGGKYTGSHTTTIDAADPILDLLERLDGVYSIALAKINTHPAGGGNCQDSIKIDRKSSACALLVISQKGANLDVYICSGRLQQDLETIARHARNIGMRLSFVKR